MIVYGAVAYQVLHDEVFSTGVRIGGAWIAVLCAMVFGFSGQLIVVAEMHNGRSLCMV